jgi:hypothetical protein
MPLKPQRTEKSFEDRPTPGIIQLTAHSARPGTLRRVGKIEEANVMCEYL